MKAKPQLKKELGIIWYYEPVRHIRFVASQDAVNDCKSFGQITCDDGINLLTVDPRFDFKEVVEYMENYG